jgi:hypothetical protein
MDECRYINGTFLALLFLFGMGFIFLANWLGLLLHFGIFGHGLCSGLGGGIAGLLATSIRLEQMHPSIRQYLEQHIEELKTS